MKTQIAAFALLLMASAAPAAFAQEPEHRGDGPAEFDLVPALRASLHDLASAPATIDSLIADLAAVGAVRVTPTARSLSDAVLYPSPFPPRFLWTAAHLVSFSVLPPEILRAYGLRWGSRRRRAMSRVAALTRTVLPLVPGPLRYVPAWRTAAHHLTTAASTQP